MVHTMVEPLVPQQVVPHLVLQIGGGGGKGANANFLDSI